MNTDHVLHGLGYAHSVTYCNAMWALNYAILGHFVIFKCFLKAFILCEQYQVFFHSGCRELLRYLKSAILFQTSKTLKQHRHCLFLTHGLKLNFAWLINECNLKLCDLVVTQIYIYAYNYAWYYTINRGLGMAVCMLTLLSLLCGQLHTQVR